MIIIHFINYELCIVSNHGVIGYFVDFDNHIDLLIKVYDNFS